jgi:predicted permease
MLHGLVLAAGGGALALVIVGVVGPVARSVLLPDVAWTGSVVDLRVLLFTGVVALATGVLTSAVPAVRAGRRDLTNELRSGIREGGGQRSALRATLTLAQITLTFVLLTGAGLFARSLSSVRGLDLGIEPDRVLAVEARWADPPEVETGTSPDEAFQAGRQRRISFYSNALERVRAVPGVSSAAVAIGTPFESSFTIDLRASGHDSIPAMEGGGPYVAAVTDGYFETAGLELLEGRTFTMADRGGSEPVAIVNRTMARRLWPDGALGECLYMLTDRVDVSCSRIVGVVVDANRFGLTDPPAMQYYIPRGQEVGFGGELLLVRPAGPTDDPQLADALRAALLEVDPGLSWVGVDRLQERIDPQVRPWRLGATLFTLFGGLALLIAAIGLYSVMAYMVADRTHEMGVRMVLGADRRAVLGLVLRKSAVLVAGGLLIGTVLALTGSRFIQPALFETSATDPAVLAGVAVVTLVAAFLASVVPAWRAVRVDPVIALRTD